MCQSHGVILVVDDERPLLNLIKLVLESGGYEVLTASSGREALDVGYDHETIDLLLTDIHMPQMTGPELACRMSERLPALPVIFVSGNQAGTPGAEMLLREGPFADCRVIRKPFTPNQLLDEVHQVLPTAEPLRRLYA